MRVVDSTDEDEWVDTRRPKARGERAIATVRSLLQKLRLEGMILPPGKHPID
jgi:hypothetical protein